MTVLGLQQGIIYGPVNSRRLGRSLGINLLPARYKLCSFDCVYCHYGRTAVPAMTAAEEHFPGVATVLAEVEKALRGPADFDYLTFSGNGEATLHPRFPEIVSGVRRLRDALRPGVRLAILSNSTTVHLPHIRAALARIDAPIMKLDAGDAPTLERINRPAPGVTLEQMVEGLKQVPGLVIQSVLVDGLVSNARGEALEAWLEAVAEVRPTRVQIYSTDRPVADAGVETVPPEALRRIAEDARSRTGIAVEAFWAAPR
jgi:wyosine [tRNA(Phe)-imidazoG37] synthetase (radical SAM superfamily)